MADTIDMPVCFQSQTRIDHPECRINEGTEVIAVKRIGGRAIAMNSLIRRIDEFVSSFNDLPKQARRKPPQDLQLVGIDGLVVVGEGFCDDSGI